MLEVAILGAGELGGALAHVLARRDLARTIYLIDDTKQIAAGKALDIMQAGPVEAFSTAVRGTPDLAVAAGAHVVIVADRAGGPEWSGEEGLHLLRQTSQMGRRRLTLCAGATQRDLVDRGVREAGFAPSALVGTAPEALAAAVRALVALKTDASVKEVALTLLGVPPGQAVVPWEDATVGGTPLTALLDEPSRRQLAAQIAPLWPPGPHALAHAATEAVACITGVSRRTISAFVAPSRDRAFQVKTVALPVRLAAQGADVRLPTLSASARVAFDNSMAL